MHEKSALWEKAGISTMRLGEILLARESITAPQLREVLERHAGDCSAAPSAGRTQPPQRAQRTAAMSLAKIGELLHSPLRPRRATATWAGLNSQALTASVAS